MWLNLLFPGVVGSCKVAEADCYANIPAPVVDRPARLGGRKRTRLSSAGRPHKLLTIGFVSTFSSFANWRVHQLYHSVCFLAQLSCRTKMLWSFKRQVKDIAEEFMFVKLLHEAMAGTIRGAWSRGRQHAAGTIPFETEKARGGEYEYLSFQPHWYSIVYITSIAMKTINIRGTRIRRKYCIETEKPWGQTSRTV